LSPVTAAFLATAAGGLACGLVGIAAGRWSKHREIAWWEDTYADLAATYHADLSAANAQIAEALRIIADLTDARQANPDDADPFPASVVVPPRVWRALQEARENPEAN